MPEGPIVVDQNLSADFPTLMEDPLDHTPRQLRRWLACRRELLVTPVAETLVITYVPPAVHAEACTEAMRSGARVVRQFVHQRAVEVPHQLSDVDSGHMP